MRRLGWLPWVSLALGQGGCAALLQGDPTVELTVPHAAVSYGFEPRLEAENGALLAPQLGGLGGFVFKGDRRVAYRAVLSPLGYRLALRRQWRPALAADLLPLSLGLGASAALAWGPRWSVGATALSPSLAWPLLGLGALGSGAMLGLDAWAGAWWETPPQTLPALVP